MKRDLKKKLQLEKTTVRELSANLLKNVAGGAVATSGNATCMCTDNDYDRPGCTGNMTAGCSISGSV